MQPLRGYDSLSLGDLLQGIVPASLSPPNMPDAWNAPYPGSSSLMALQANTTPPRQIGITRESLAALKQAMARIAPHLPPDLLQRHYINRLVELSNPTPATLYPVHSYDTALPTAGSLGRTEPAAPNPPNPSATDSPFVRAVMERFAASPDASNRVQPVRMDDAPLSTGDLLGGSRPTPLSAPNVPTAMDSHFVRAAMARLSTSPAANGHIQVGGALLSGNDARGHITAPALSSPDFTTTNPGATTKYGRTEVRSRWPYTIAEKYLDTGLDYLDAGARWVPVLGPGLDLIDDYNEGDVLGGLIDTGLLAADGAGGYLLKAPAKAAWKGIREGQFLKEIEPWWKSGSHEWRGVDPKLKWRDGTRTWYGEMNGVPKGEPIHHWLIPQRMGWLFPKALINQPWNLLPMTRAAELGKEPEILHGALHGYKKDKYLLDKDPLRNLLKKYEYGTPDWAKIGIPAYGTMAVGNVVKGTSDK